MDTECIVLYTHQKQKKAKTWHDGVLKILTPGTRAILYDDKKTKIDTVHVKPEAIVSGEQLESDRHLILIEEIKSGIDYGQIQDPSGQPGVREQPAVQVHPKVPTASGTGGRLSMRAGIKRKKTGFVPPRMVKQPRLDVDEGQTDSYRNDCNSRMVGSSPPLYTNTERNPDAVGILSLYSRIGAAKPSDSIQKSEFVSTYSSGLQANTGRSVGSPIDQRPSTKNESPLLDRLTCEESPSISSLRSSPWTSFGACRLGPKGGDSPRNAEGGSNKRLLYGTKSNHQNVTSNIYSRTTIFSERNMQKDQTNCDKKGSSNVCAVIDNMHKTSSKILITDTNTGTNTAIKRSASQIMALLGKSRDKEPMQAEIQNKDKLQDSSDLSVYSSALLECHTDNTCHQITATDTHQSTSGKEFSVHNNTASANHHKRIQNEVDVKTSYNGKMHESISNFDFYLSTNPSESRDKHHLSDNHSGFKAQRKTEDFIANTKSKQCKSEGDVWEKQSGENQNVKNTSQEDIHPSQDNINVKAISGDICKSDLFSQEKTGEGSVSGHEIEQLDYESSFQDSCVNEERRDESIDKNVTAVYNCRRIDKPDVYLSDDDLEVDNIDAVQPGSFLINFSPLSQASNSDDESDLHSSHNTEVYPKQNMKRDQAVENNLSQQDQCLVDNGARKDQCLVYNRSQQDNVLVYNRSQQDNVLVDNRSQQEQALDGCQSQQGQASEDCRFQQGQVVEVKNELTNKIENSGEMNSLETIFQLTGLKEENSMEVMACHVEGNDKWSDSKIDSSAANVQLTGSSEKNISLEIRDSWTIEINGSQSPKTGECAHSPEALVVHSVTSEQVNSLNDLHFSPDSVTFSSLSSAEGREESRKLDASSWQTKILPGSHLTTDSLRFSVISSQSTNQEFPKIIVSCPETTSKNIVLHSDVMCDITNIIPKNNPKHQCNDVLEPARYETSPDDCTPCDDSLASSGHNTLRCKQLSVLQGHRESVSQTESATNEFGRNTPSPGFVDNCLENSSPILVCHPSKNSTGGIVPGNGTMHHYDTIAPRTTQEQLSLAEPMRSTQYKKHSSVVEKCNMTEEPLPHPSKLLRQTKTTAATNTLTDQEDPFAHRATQRLQEYKVRGSVSGGMARRTSNSVSGLDYNHPRSPSLSVTEVLRTNMSPSHTLENARSLLDQDDYSLFIDWDVDKPKLVDINTLFNAQDIKIPGSPYQHVPTAIESSCSYKGVCDDSVNVPDIDINRTKQIDSRNQATVEDFTSHYFSDESGPCVLTPECDLRDVPSKSNRILFEAESPTYGNMFKEKRDMISCNPDSKLNTFCDHLDKHVVEKTCKEKVSLKCKPFQDLYTHTSYTSKYFSPPQVEFRGQKDISANENIKDVKNVPTSVDSRTQNDTPASIDSEIQMDETNYIKQPYMDSQHDILDAEINNKNGEQLIRDECSFDKKADLSLSLSSVGSSDLDLSFTLTDYHKSQPKPHNGFHQEDQLCMYTPDSGDTGDLRPWNTTDFKSTKMCEGNVPSRANGCNGSKWGKFILKEDQDDELIFDNSFDEQYNARKLQNRVCFKSVSQKLPSVNDPYIKIPENSGQLPYNKSVINTPNHQSSEKLSSFIQKPYMSIHNTKQQTMSQPVTNSMLNQVMPDNTDVSSTSEIISQDVFMDDIDVQNMDGMTDCSRFPKQNNAKPDLHIVPLSSTALTHMDKLDVIPSRSKHVITEKLSTSTSKYVSASSQNATNSISYKPVAKCDGFPKQNTMKKFRSPLPSSGLVAHVLKGSKRNISGELQFASKEEVDCNPLPLRELSITVNFPNIAVYKRVLIAVLREHLNIILFGLAQQYHHTLGMADISNYIPSQPSGPLVNKSASTNQASTNPSCQCGMPSKMIQVKKAGNNKGRFFFACNAARNKQCKYFQWVDQSGGMRTSTSGSNKLKLCEASSINTYMRGNHLMLYCECELMKKADYTSHFKQGVPNWVKNKYGQTNQDKKKLYIKLSKKDASSLYSKDDLWIISTTLNFLPSQTFLAKSVYFGPNSANEVEIEPVAGFSPSNWSNHAFCHAVLAGNIASELCYLSNIEENMSPMSLPILPWILDRNPNVSHRESSQHDGFKAPVRTTGSLQTNMFATKTSTMELAEEFIQRFSLNTDQTKALIRVCNMFCGGDEGQDSDPVLLIHGVFGAGKSFLLSVIVLFLVKLFDISDSYTPGVPYPWKILISSTTNVAVDRILLGLLDIGFEDFVRVGSVKKISKPVLPFSVHATGSESQELKDLQEMLRSGELTPSEKHNVRQCIEKHRLGENKKRLSNVRVVGVTCASCIASSLDRITFPVVLLDESSQMTEPASMIPIAKFRCEKLLLVGDPKQLDPTIQGSEAAHNNGLEQTLFDRLMKMGHTPTVLRTQYRCHPVISNLANTLFYDGQLIDGVTTSDREPLVPEVPTLCFFDVSKGQEQTDDGGSFYNEKEAGFVTSLIQALLVRGVEPASIGVITLYKSQMFKINTSLLTNVQSDNCKEIKATRVSTVDAFQGGEHDIIILSCVRTNGVGFIDNHKRTNVALTRARHHLLIVGSKSNLSRNQLWHQVLQLCGGQPGGVCDADAFLHQLKNTYRGQLQDNMSTPCSPPMSLSSQETNSVVCSPQQDKGSAVTGPESSPCVPSDRPVGMVMKKCRLINADLLNCVEPSDSDEELPSL